MAFTLKPRRMPRPCNSRYRSPSLEVARLTMRGIGQRREPPSSPSCEAIGSAS
jgi:hypothetical protein